MMSGLVFLLCCLLGVHGQTKPADYDYAANQLVDFYESTEGPVGVMTTANGEPIEYTTATYTNPRNIFINPYFLDAISHMNRERIPERVAHPKGIGAFGYFEVTKDVTKYIRAKFLQEVGKKTEVAARLSEAFGQKGAPESAQGGRGFAVKFYTEEGNLDLACIGSPVFTLDDPVDGASFIHTNFPNPVTSLTDANMLWDGIVQRPQQLNTYIHVLSDTGLPDGYINFDSHAVHTYEIENENGDLHYVRFNFKSNQGSIALTLNQSLALAANDTRYFTRQLYNAIARGDYPSWTLNMQVMTYEDTEKASFDPFNVNKYWPEDQYPPQEIGRVVLNRNTANWFNDAEQAAYNPGNLVPGINGGVDSTFLARAFLYKDTQYHRLGPNHLDLPVNKAKNRILSYNRDGVANSFNVGSGPNYYPNMFNGPEPYVFCNRSNKTLIGNYIPKPRDTVFSQSTAYYLSMSDLSRRRLATNLSRFVSAITSTTLQNQVFPLFYQIHPELGENVQGMVNGTIALEFN